MKEVVELYRDFLNDLYVERLSQGRVTPLKLKHIEEDIDTMSHNPEKIPAALRTNKEKENFKQVKKEADAIIAEADRALYGDNASRKPDPQKFGYNDALDVLIWGAPAVKEMKLDKELFGEQSPSMPSQSYSEAGMWHRRSDSKAKSLTEEERARLDAEIFGPTPIK